MQQANDDTGAWVLVNLILLWTIVLVVYCTHYPARIC